jgi:hypothetical protein
MDRPPTRLILTTVIVVALLAGSATGTRAHPRPAAPVDVELAALMLPVATPVPAETTECTTEQVPAHDLWLPTPVGAVLAPDTDPPGARPQLPEEGRAPPAA